MEMTGWVQISVSQLPPRRLWIVSRYRRLKGLQYMLGVCESSGETAWP